MEAQLKNKTINFLNDLVQYLAKNPSLVSPNNIQTLKTTIINTFNNQFPTVETSTEAASVESNAKQLEYSLAPGLIARTQDNLLAFLTPTEFYTYIQSLGGSVPFRITPTNSPSDRAIRNEINAGNANANTNENIDAQATNIIVNLSKRIDASMYQKKSFLINPVYHKIVEQINSIMPILGQVIDQQTNSFVYIKKQLDELVNRVIKQNAEIAYLKAYNSKLKKSLLDLQRK